MGVVRTDVQAEYEVIEADAPEEWLVVREPGWSDQGTAAAIIKAHSGGVYCYPNSPPYEQLGPYRTVSSAFAAFAFLSTGMG
jgi:hypothetical protein